MSDTKINLIDKVSDANITSVVYTANIGSIAFLSKLKAKLSNFNPEEKFYYTEEGTKKHECDLRIELPKDIDISSMLDNTIEEIYKDGMKRFETVFRDEYNHELSKISVDGVFLNDAFLFLDRFIKYIDEEFDIHMKYSYNPADDSFDVSLIDRKITLGIVMIFEEEMMNARAFIYRNLEKPLELIAISSYKEHDIPIKHISSMNIEFAPGLDFKMYVNSLMDGHDLKSQVLCVSECDPYLFVFTKGEDIE